ncbi:hypothetical protein D1AOALGA4SA_8734 [Olavius algarvensis Delta 1 endosymbiont]|nr:hypothetical protein D1AOALGA4SA_8734 [Olavius algarvensis Delta 1 endosymbiont]
MLKLRPLFMHKYILILFSLAVMVLSGLTGSGLAAPEAFNDSQIVRVYFDDRQTAHQIAAWIEPMESNYETGYLVLEVTTDEYDRLLAAGLRVEVDDSRKAQIAAALQAVAPAAQAIPGFGCYRTVEETFATAESIASSYPVLATWTDIGDSWQKTVTSNSGYDLMVLRLTNSAVSGPKPKIFITSAIHAREYTTAELMTRMAEYLVNNYIIDADATWLLDYHEIHLMLQANPDGRKMAETGLLWRKNTNTDYCSPTSNNRGADLNRNFDFKWDCCGGSSRNECSSTFHGADAASEPETQAIQNYIFAEFPDQRGDGDNDPVANDASGIYLDIHSSGRLLLWPWGWTSNPAPNASQLQTLGRKLAFFNGHEPKQSIGLYPTDGTTTSFAYGDMGLAAFTYELGTEFFESCNYFENTIVPDNTPSLIYAMKAARTPYMTPAGPDAVNLTVNFGSLPPGIPADTMVTLSAAIDDSRYNNSNGTEPTQSIAAAEYYVDVPPWVTDPTPVALPMSAVDGGFNSSVEAVQATIDTNGWSEGQHIVFVRGQDAAGNWGAFSAVFVYIDNGGQIPYTIFEADFNINTDGFIYADDTFRGTGAPAYAEGTRTASGGFSGGGLQVTVGGIDNADIFGMSGGWQRSVTLSAPAFDVNLSFNYNLTQASDYESDEFSQALVSVDGVLYGSGANDYVAQIVGNGNGGGAQSTGWQLFQANLGNLAAGDYSFVFGLYNNLKTYNNESSVVVIDNVMLTGFSDGADLVTVPDVAGMDQAAAEAAIIDVELTVGTVSTTNSSTVPPDVVISQNPAAGTLVVSGSAVDLVVSLGPASEETVNWDTTPTEAYSNQDNSGTIEAQDGGLTFYMQGNRWRRTTDTYTITPQTVIEFEFMSTSQGEIHGIGFDEDNTLTNAPRIFNLYGTQNWSADINWTPRYSGSGAFESFTIPVGQYYTGSGFHLVVVNDKDSGTLDNNSWFSNVRIFEDTPPPGSCTVETDFESGGANGWINNAASTCSTGTFVVGTPTEIVNSGVTTQLAGDHTTGSGNAFFTAVNNSAGVNDVDGGNCITESPAYPVDEDSDVSVWYYHGQRDAGDDPAGDFFLLEISTNGGTTWSPLVSVGDATVDAAWSEATAAVSAGDDVKFRVQVSDGAGPGDLVEAGIDDVTICPAAP